MEGDLSESGYGTALSHSVRSTASGYRAAVWPTLAISLLAAALNALSTCAAIRPNRTGVLVIPLRMGLAKDNGARPLTVKDLANLDSYPDLAIVLVDEDAGRNEYTLSAYECFQEFPDSWCLAFHGLQPTKSSSTARLLLAGSVFLDHYYAVFDDTADPVRIGIATRVDP